MMKRLLIPMVALMAAATASASQLLQGSIDFNGSELWGKAVYFGFDDNGNYTGTTRWYSDEDSSAAIYRYNGRSAGYLESGDAGDIHRSIMALATSEEHGPTSENGRDIPSGGIYIDTEATINAHSDFVENVTDSSKDKLNCWIYVPEDESVTNFVITAGYVKDSATIGVTNYVTDAKVTPGVEFQLTIRAIPNAFPEEMEGLVGFEVYVDGKRVSAGDTDVFPCLLAPDSEYGKRLYSFGSSGAARLDRINFTKVNPIDEPTYAEDDVTMLREYADITVEGVSATATPLVNFPVAIRISESRIKNFHYSRTAANGSDLRFTDENGKLLAHEVDSWNREGESIVWVRIPYLRKGTTIRMHWGLKRGLSAPSVDSELTWSEYIAVWHFNDVSLGFAKDSTGNGFNATREDGTGTLQNVSGKFGNAALVSGTSLVCADYDLNYSTYHALSLSGYYMTPGYEVYGETNSAMVAGKRTPRLANGEAGWGFFTKDSQSYALRFGGSGPRLVSQNLGLIDRTWAHLAIAENLNSVTFFANLVNNHGTAKNYEIPVAVTNFVLAGDGVAVDELRIRRPDSSRTVDELRAWIGAEYAQMTNLSFMSRGSANVKGDDNYWVVEPSVTPIAVSVDEADKIVVNVGKPRFGTAFARFYDSEGKLLSAQPTEAGSYRVIVTVSPGAHDGLEKALTFVIFEKRAYHAISGYDRVMLFNSDETPECPVTLQGYYDVDDATNEVWSHTGTAWSGKGKFVRFGNVHVYTEPNGSERRLWTFRNARIGNLFQSDTALAAGMNFLPWGGGSMRYDDSEMKARSQRYAGTLILQNVSTETAPDDPAAAYSPYYDNGIGTVYFDAVNAYTAYSNRLKLQICGTDDGDVEQGEWTDVKVDVFRVKDGEFYRFDVQTNVTEFTLAANEPAGTTNDFYRVRARIDTNAAVRVRIVRTDTNWAEGAGEDGAGLVSIDNIIISNPAMGATLSQYGLAEDLNDPVFVGRKAPFDIAFPGVGDLGKLHAMVKVNYISNNEGGKDPTFIGAMTMNYRWRYLDQSVGDWQEIVLRVSEDDPEKFVSDEAIEGYGIGDIEYNANAVVNAPFYEYWDYSGLNLGWSNYSERRGDEKIDAMRDGVYDASHLSAAFGTNYFIRLREGSSDYEGFNLYVKRADSDSAAATKVQMELLSDHTWRGYYPTLTNVTAGLYYRLEGVNRQTATGVDYQFNTNCLYGSDKKELPANDILKTGTAEDWALVPCDGVTGYLMFQLDDSTLSCTVIHADYQNFNAWTDARTDDALFVGTSTALPTSGVSRTAKSYDDVFGNFYESVATNASGYWRESFEEKAEETGKWAVEVPFKGTKKTPNGWTAGNGMWVPQRYRRLGDSSIAFQMKGEGYGTIQFPQSQSPRGIESFTYSARAAQSFDIHSFNYYAGTTNDVYSMSNYTFVVACAMTTTNDTDFTGLGTVSAVAHYRDSIGGYEARVERTGDNQVQLCLYKWFSDGTYQFLGRSGDQSYSNCGFSAKDSKFAALFISCTNTAEGVVTVTAGILANSKEVSNAELSGQSFFKVCYEDSDSPYVCGTFGVGAKDCPAVFARPVFSPVPVAVATDWSKSSENFHWWTTSKIVNFKTPQQGEHAVIREEGDYVAWNIYRERLAVKDFTNDLPRKVYGFKAQIPNQYVIVETSPHLENDWTAFTNVQIRSFNLDEYVIKLYECEDTDIQLRTGDAAGSADVVVDDLSLRQWRGEDYDDDENPDSRSGVFGDIGYGAPTNFVYTTAWIGPDSDIELSAMRTTVDRPASVRSPLMDGRSGRGIGLGVFSFAYRDADRHAKLLVQVLTNSIGVTTLAEYTESFDGWETIAAIDFGEMSEDDRQSGIVSTYIGAHGVAGVMRVVVDPEAVVTARDPAINVGTDPTFGSVYITMAGAKDNPSIDNYSWWGWNLRTTDEKLRWLLKDASANDTRRKGLAFALNDSITADVRPTDQYAQHKPFLQTPIFSRGVVGEVSFKARRYDAGDASPTVAIYGTTSLDPEAKDAEFDYLDEIAIDCDRFETFVYQAPVSKNYTAFRLAVTGVEGIVGDGSDYSKSNDPLPCGRDPESGYVKRVLIDEVSVFEAIRARLGFKNVGAFRSRLSDNRAISGMPRRDEQPLCGESWGVQAELYAAQLSEKIDLKTPGREPRVFFHWYEGETPWGYSNWKGLEGAGSAELAHAERTDELVYRSGYFLAPDAVVKPSTKSGQIVQYSLDVVYYMEDQDDPLTNTLSSADWERPEWYAPVDLNAKYGGSSGAFSAYNILDTVAPGWAWFNEVNLFGGWDDNFSNLDRDYQYLEIAAPAEADLTDWSVQMVTSEMGNSYVTTNTVATFGKDGLTGTKKDLMHAASGMVFRVIASLPTRKGKKITVADGTLDGVWTFPNPDDSVLNSDGTISTTGSFGIRLVRPSGIVEHEIVALGTNFWAESDMAANYDPTNVANRLNRLMSDSRFFYVGDDDAGLNRSRSVWDSRGETSNVWDKTMICTPGKINVFADGTPQNLDPDHPTPLGTSVFVYADVGSANITQTCGDGYDTTATQILVIQRGSVRGTDITYRVSRWYELGEVTTNGYPIADSEKRQIESETFRVTVGVGASNNVYVTAKAQVCKKLRDFGIDDDNKYTPAILKWFTDHTDMYGNEWENYEEGDIVPAKWLAYGADPSTGVPMSLTEMYWLDLCPTVSNQYVIAGLLNPGPKPVSRKGDETLTNTTMGVYMAISNGLAHAGKTVYPPYVVRGLTPGHTSWDFASPTNSCIWTNASFKINGIMLNGQTSMAHANDWVGLRWFVFDDKSFPKEGENAFVSAVEILDPYSKDSPGYEAGWREWVEKHPGVPRPLIGYSWGFDEKMRLFSVELMKTNNFYEAEN